jgi:uncharacterized protein YdeI (YjbR/CyaY-like superfamily)
VKPENVRFLESAASFRTWLEANHDKAAFQWVGFYKKAAGPRKSLTYDEAVEEALCYGWIDGQTYRIDDLSNTIRFSPRRKGSHWSESNHKRVARLIEAGRMAPAGMRVYEERSEPVVGEYTYETRPAELPRDLEETFRANPQAWEFYAAQPAGYRKAMTWYVVSAKRDETRRRRLAVVMDESAKERRIDLLNTPKLRPRG